MIALIVVMAGALVALLFRDSDSVAADATLAPTTIATTSTTSTSSTSTTSITISPEARIAEVEVILEDLYLRRFDAIYRRDESVLADIVALQGSYDAAVDAMPTAEFIASPAEVGVDVTVLGILLDRPDCLVLHYDMDVSRIFGPGRTTGGVRVLWPRGDDGPWRMARSWSGPGDLWNVDCDLVDRTEIP